MVKKHLKRQNAPKTWRINRKGSKFIVKSNPGKKMDLSMPIALVFKEYLKYCKTTKEVKTILMDKEVIVDGKRRKKHRYPVGFMDVLSIPVADENYRMIMDSKGKLMMLPIEKKEADVKICKIVDKTVIDKDTIQLNLFDGSNMKIKSSEDEFKVGDSLIIKRGKTLDIKKSCKLDKGSYAVLIGGKHKGAHGVVEKVEKDHIEIKTDGNNLITNKRYAYIIGEGKPEVKATE